MRVAQGQPRKIAEEFVADDPVCFGTVSAVGDETREARCDSGMCRNAAEDPDRLRMLI
jgi:hypothetical protein